VLHLGHPGNKSGRGAIAPDEFRAMLEKIWAGRTLAKQEEPQEEVLL